ncbi:ribonuclease T2 [Conidiobolus coronatus NRRL 28638]|uniref:ribonuclease T2 n=1 Tax=Conidiobolus coronatus (strain ATCC 28846 / CBS 209.66 / NRRL 28638) TaxID=796925 RepID=A0A137P961_CONC2|nr:ribonuclease T2 [Conidiobolus coronatus NRRL 28638]|eukprot:KXN71522.1 ribonuclease T2 [Conidiobolus coronatus NRRL 28638]
MGSVVLALQWVSGLGPSNQWTIHGLWPNNCDGSYGPSNGCDNDRNYDNMADIVAVDSALESKMNTYWPSYKGNNPDFWSHEWNKHGTCVSTLDPNCYANYTPQQEVRDYFNKVLELRDQYDLYPILSQQGITPGRTYTRDQLQTAFKNGLGANVYLSCKSKALQEVRVYFSVTGTSDYSVANTNPAGNCPATGIRYAPK